MNEERMKLKMKILKARDERVNLIKEQLKSNQVIVSLRANYPGDYKDQDVTRTLVREIDYVLNQKIDIVARSQLNCGEGPVFIYRINSQDPKQIKEQSIKIEDEHPFGRLIDLDVYYKSEQSLSRREFNYNARTCFLCDQVAFMCIRKKNHTVDELTSYIHRVVKQYEKRGL